MEVDVKTMSVTDEEHTIENDLLEVKRIQQRSYALEKKMLRYKNIDLVAHFEEMCEHTEQLYKIIDRNGLQQIWTDISTLELTSHSEIEPGELSWRKHDLCIDIAEYYNMGKESSIKFIEDFKRLETHEESSDYKNIVTKFSTYAKYMSGMLLDLYERLRTLKLLIDPNSEELSDRSSTISQISLILKRSDEICNMFDSNNAGKSEFDEIVRINRRMTVVLKEAQTIRLSDDLLAKCEAMKNIILMKDQLYEGNEIESPMAFIIWEYYSLEAHVQMHCRMFSKKCMNYAAMLYKANPKENHFDYSKIGNIVRNLKNVFEEIANKFDLIDIQFEKFKDMVEGAWILK